MGTYTLNAKGRFVTIFMLMVILLGVCGVLNPIVSMDAYASNIFDIVDNTGAIDPTAGGVSAADNTADSIATVLTKGKAIALGYWRSDIVDACFYNYSNCKISCSW